MTLAFTDLNQASVEAIMPIEQACHSHPWNEKLMRSCIGGRYFGAVAKLNNKIIGFYIADNVVGDSTLMDICVAPEQQGNGYGKALLNQYLSHAKKLDCLTLFLEVRSSNISAQMLYINHGYVETGRRTGYYPKAIGYEDAIIMRKNLG
ncbi:ribosomal protein S18-alanine N-acetyltransferase [Thalassotalea eurytherma]|uniref:[Ribosomal protein bS18]-alanine N-acetyltransferase n=1 Tax=Thalassotalea eurytherma TaxID=1144278 RepID=A0ABQ6GZF7_9GAMM|nr:ribosomal protein S18-alanine N-acetyltransferase [Thalassotalea eurytherma]GLX81348.1 ribosomal-protein-alanine acetyltransferase [Thalassotalea eurytherma]